MSSPRKAVFKRKRICPFSGQNGQIIDYKDPDSLKRFTTPDRGRIIPRRITFAKADKQRELQAAIKRARMLALLPFKTTNNITKPKTYRG